MAGRKLILWQHGKEQRAIMVVTDTIVALMNKVPDPVATLFRSETFGARLLRPLVNRLVPRNPTWVVVRSGEARGLHLLIDPQHEKFYWSGTHELVLQQVIARILKPGMTFWDIGANIGFFTLLASRYVGEAGQVHAFEPMDQNRERLLAAVAVNRCNNITIHNCALAAIRGEALLHAHASPLMWTLVPNRGQQKGQMVTCATLDDLALSVPLPDLIKIDVEGAELGVLCGGVQFLATAKPCLLVEFSDAVLPTKARELLSFYTFTRLTPQHWLLADEIALADKVCRQYVTE